RAGGLHPIPVCVLSEAHFLEGLKPMTGIITDLHPAHGFILQPGRPTWLFFHKTDLEGGARRWRQLRHGDVVEFEEQLPAVRRRRARSVRRLPASAWDS